MNFPKTTTATALIMMITALSAQANDAHYDYARVTAVTPITRLVTVTVPTQECWNEEVEHRQRGEDGTAGMILGGIIGGAVGNRFGKGNGNKAAIAAGAILGAGIGQNMNKRPGGTYVSTETRCETVNQTHQEERVDGYRVRYEYNGQSFYTRLSRDPGQRLKVRVSVTPIE